MDTAEETTSKQTGKKPASRVSKGVKPAAKAATAKPRRDTLNLRIPPAERNLIDRAAASAGKTRTNFILEAARKAAEIEILDRAVMAVEPEAYVEFLRRLDAPMEPNERLRNTMQTPPPWDRT